MSLRSVTPARRSDPLRFLTGTYAAFGPYLGEDNLNLGCGRNLEPGFLNLDRVTGPGVDVVCDLEAGHLPFPDASLDCVQASHVLEHITHLIPLLREVHRVLKPGGYLLAIVPHAASDDAWEDPTHVRAFTEGSWMHFDRRTYARNGHHGSYPSPVDFCFDVEKIILMPQESVIKELAAMGIGPAETALNFGKRFLRNVVLEMRAVLKKVDA